ncbi:MAG: flavodoxin family protein [Oscillospiraceae bacterium]
MSDILCLYYSRTGKTRAMMQEVAEALGAELVEISDGIDRSGALGYFMCGIDAMRRGTHRTKPFYTERDLEDYRLVILGSPIWAGRCSSVMRGFLKRHGLELHNVVYVLNRSSEHKDEDIYGQMDRYTAEKHLAAASLRYGAVGYDFWRDQFLTEMRNLLAALPQPPKRDKTVTDFVPEEERPRRRRRRREGEHHAG